MFVCFLSDLRFSLDKSVPEISVRTLNQVCVILINTRSVLNYQLKTFNVIKTSERSCTMEKNTFDISKSVK